MTMTLSPQEMAQAIALYQALQAPKQKAVSSTPTAVLGHGTYGLFAYPGLEPGITNAMVMPKYGLLDVLPSRTANTDNPLYGIMTGVTASSGSEPSGVCDDPPTAGLMKMCTHAFQWGRFSRMTRVYDLDKFGRYRDRSDFNDLTLFGDPLSNTPAAAAPGVPGMTNATQALRTDIQKALFEFAVTWARDFARLLYTGNPSNNTAGDGYKEPYGLDVLINDNYRDAVTGTACPAADSIVENAASLEVNTNGSTYLRTFASIMQRLRFNASRMGLDPATWAIVMPWSLFYELTEVWSCAYMTYRCQSNIFSTSQTQVIDAGDTIAMRDSMRQDQYLLIDGERVQVILDDEITETPLAGSSFRSTVYFVPLRYVGNRPATYLEYFNYDGPGAAMEAARIFAPNGSYYTTNAGRYLWHVKPPTNFCVQMLAKTEWRVIVETPQIAARLENVKWTPRAHQRDWDPDSSFYVNGGGTTRTDNSYYSPTT